MPLSAMKRPHFRDPPIIEQAIAVVFERIRGFDNVDFGLFWSEVSEQFQHADSSHRLTHAIESFDGRDHSVSIVIAPPNPMGRSLFRNDLAGELLQIQDDGLTFNWIKETPDHSYPRYERTSARFAEFYEKFSAFVERRHGEPLRLRQCELINVNMIPVQDFDQITDVFAVNGFDWPVAGLVAETYVRHRQHLMVDDDGQSYGRLHSDIVPVFDQSNARFFQFTLTARSAPTVGSFEAVRHFINRAHDLINAAFLHSVHSRMLDKWGEYDGE